MRRASRWPITGPAILASAYRRTTPTRRQRVEERLRSELTIYDNTVARWHPSLGHRAIVEYNLSVEVLSDTSFECPRKWVVTETCGRALAEALGGDDADDQFRIQGNNDSLLGTFDTDLDSQRELRILLRLLRRSFPPSS